MRRWGVWVLLLGGVVVLMYFDYIWEFNFLYWVHSQVQGVLDIIWPSRP